ncbi:hypothetical protein ABT324_02015 [Saccharopolyspora sp. NPDC000359]|uniref:hypothetical protein n=1 Tax=Saccharopolyspora sp. NPDC000359 TaxID=3154251 RepID=UPI003320DFAB
MSSAVAPIITATARWLTTAYPAPSAGALSRALAEAQATQAVTVAAQLRYPTTLDADLVRIAGPGGAARLDALVGGPAEVGEADDAWRTWVDEVLASWAACLLGDPELAARAVDAVTADSQQFSRLLDPGDRDRSAAALLRHPDLLVPVAELHRALLDGVLSVDSSNAA